MITIIVGTNRPNSKSRKVAEYYQKLFEMEHTPSQILDLVDLPHDFIFSALYGNAGKNEAFNHFKDIVNASDKFIFVIPEYNGSFPGVLKSFIDGMDFPGSFNNKKAGMVGLASGVMGGALAMSAFTDILHYMSMHVYPIKPRIAKVSSSFVDGIVTDKFVADLIQTQVSGFVKY